MLPYKEIYGSSSRIIGEYDNMARPKYSNVRSLGDIITTYDWDLVFTKEPTGVTIDRNLNYKCTTTTLPKGASDMIQIAIRGHKIWQPGIFNYGENFSLTFVDTKDLGIQKMVKQWFEKQWSYDSGSQALNSDCYADIKIMQLDRQNSNIGGYILEHCYLQDFSLQDLQGENSAVQTVTINIHYDRYKTENI